MSGLIYALVLATTAFVLARVTGEKDTMSFYAVSFAAGTYMVACDIRSMLRQEQGK